MRNKLFSYVCVPAAAFAALLAPSVRAQVETFDTISSYNLDGSDAIQGFGSQSALTQTFTNVQELNDMTYQFVTVGTASSVSTNVTAYLVDWTSLSGGVHGEVTNTNVLWSQSFVVPPTNNVGVGGWSTVNFPNNSGTYTAYNEYLNVDTFLTPSDTYAMVLLNTNASNAQSNIGLEDIFQEYPFTSDGTINGTSYGTAYASQGTVTSLSYLTNHVSVTADGGVWGFSQIDVIPAGNTTPEPRTAAVALCGLFVAILMGRHLVQNRKLLAGATLA